MGWTKGHVPPTFYVFNIMKKMVSVLTRVRFQPKPKLFSEESRVSNNTLIIVLKYFKFLKIYAHESNVNVFILVQTTYVDENGTGRKPHV